MFDYSNLLGRIKTVFKTQEAFGEAMDMSLSQINARVNNKVDWSSAEIIKACEVLKLDTSAITDYFFTEKV